MGRVAGEERAGALRLEASLRDRSRVGEREAGRALRSPRSERACEPRERPRARRERAEQDGLDRVPLLDERRQQLAVRARVRSERVRRRADVELEHDGRLVVERMRDLRRRVHPLDRELEPAEERRVLAHRVDRRADVVHEPRQRQLERARASADRLLLLVHGHVDAGFRERDRGAQPVGAGSDHDRGRHQGRKSVSSRQNSAGRSTIGT